MLTELVLEPDIHLPANDTENAKHLKWPFYKEERRLSKRNRDDRLSKKKRFNSEAV